MTTSRITKLEARMFEQGYASSRMCSYKLKKNFKSVLRQVKREHFRAVRVGQQQFIEISSVQEHYGEQAGALLGLDDWSDVFWVDAKEELHVRREEAEAS